MAVTEVIVSRTVKCNTGDYESTDHFISMKADVEGEEDAMQVRKDLTHLVEKSMVGVLLTHYKARGKNVNADFVIRRHGLGQAKGK